MNVEEILIIVEIGSCDRSFQVKLLQYKSFCLRENMDWTEGNGTSQITGRMVQGTWARWTWVHQLLRLASLK